MSDQAVRSIERAIDILYCLAEGEKGLVEIGRQVNLGKATVHRQLTSLINKGIVAQNPATNDYTLGPGFFRLLHNSLKSYDPLVAVAYEPMIRLNKLSDETIMLHVVKGTQRVCIAEVKSTQDISYTVGVGNSVPIYVGAAGKVIFGYMPEKTRERLLADLPLTPVTENTITDKERLLEAAAEAAEKGYAMSFGERSIGAAGISVPVLAGKQAIAVLSILGPSFRFNREKMLGYLAPLQAEAEVIARKMGLE